MVIKSPYPSIEIPDIHIYDLLFKTPLSEHSQPFSPLTSSDALATTRDDTYWATRDVLIDAQNGVKYTFPVLKQRIEKLAAALANTASDPRIPFNLGKGDVLALFSNNHIDFPVVTWATVRAGGIMTAANPAYTEPELEHQLRDSGAKIVVVSRPNVALTLKVARTLGIPAKNIVLIDSRTDSERLLGGVDAPICHLESHTFLTLHGLLSLSPASPLAPLSYTPSSIRTQTAYLMYSSGTTGKSKGVEQTHGNIVANIMQIQTSERGFLPTGEKMLGVLPFFHCYGLTWIGGFEPSRARGEASEGGREGARNRGTRWNAHRRSFPFVANLVGSNRFSLVARIASRVSFACLLAPYLPTPAPSFACCRSLAASLSLARRFTVACPLTVHFSLFQGCPLVVMPGFTLPTFLSTLSTYNIHFAHLVPPIMVQMAKCPEEMLKKYDLSKLKWIVSGAAPMGSETGIEIEKRLKGARIRQGYGMTVGCWPGSRAGVVFALTVLSRWSIQELAPVSIVEAYGPRQDDGSGCIGVLLPNQVARLVDPETGKDVAQGEEGEVGLFVTSPDATAQCNGR